MILLWYLVCFDMLYQLPLFYPQGDSLGVPPDPKTCILNFNNFSNLTTKPISVFKELLSSGFQPQKFVSKGNPLRVTPRILRQFFTSNFMILSLDTKTIACILP